MKKVNTVTTLFLEAMVIFQIHLVGQQTKVKILLVQILIWLRRHGEINGNYQQKINMKS